MIRPCLVGLAGTALTATESDLLRRLQPRGVLLFRRNVRNAEQLTTLCGQLRELLGDSTWIAADQEGGAVAVLAAAVEAPPSALALGLAGDAALTERVYRRLGEDARRVGVNVILAPVADVVVGEQSVLSTRAFGSDAMAVSRHVAAALRGLRSAGVVGCAKHWPGHGRPRADSHHELPRIDASLEELLRCELVPFVAAMEARAPALMIGHLQVPAMDHSGATATASAVIVREWLRQRLRYPGILLADAIEMESAPLAQAMLDAGCDLILFARPIGEIVAHIEHLPALAESERFDRALRNAKAQVHAVGPHAAGEDVYAQARRRGLVVLWPEQQGAPKWPPFQGRTPSPVLLDVASGDRLVVEPMAGVDAMAVDRQPPTTSIFLAQLRAWWGELDWSRRLRCLAPRAPLEDWLGAIATLDLQDCDLLILAGLRPWPAEAARALSQRLGALPSRPVVVLLGDPSGERWLGAEQALLLVPGVRPADLEIAWLALQGQLEARPRDRWGD